MIESMSRRRDPSEFIDAFAAVKKRIQALAVQAYASAELGGTQAKFLRHIGSGISQAELARLTDTDPALTGRTLQVLMERGLVRRQRSKEDRREYVLELSAEGRRAQARVVKLRAALSARVVAALDDRDLDDFERIGKKILAAFEGP
jgi:DNA-binding MarR family transcriptional regulator